LRKFDGKDYRYRFTVEGKKAMSQTKKEGKEVGWSVRTIKGKKNEYDIYTRNKK